MKKRDRVGDREIKIEKVGCKVGDINRDKGRVRDSDKEIDREKKREKKLRLQTKDVGGKIHYTSGESSNK